MPRHDRPSLSTRSVLDADPLFPERDAVLGRHHVSLRWLGASILIGTVGSALMASALFLSLDGSTTVVAPGAPRAIHALNAEGEDAGPDAKLRGDRLVRDEMIASDKESFSARVTQEAGDHEVVKIRPFVRLATSLAAAIGPEAGEIPRFDPIRLFARADDAERPSEPAAADPSDAEITIARADLSEASVSDAMPAMSDDEVTALVEEERRLAAATGRTLTRPFASQSLLARTLGAAYPDDPDAALTAGAEADPFRAIEVHVIPENVTAIPKADPAAVIIERRDLTLKRGETLAAALAGSGAGDDVARAVLAVLSEHARTGLSEGQHLRLLFAPGPEPDEPRQLRRVTLYGSEGIEEIAAAKDRGGFVAVAPPPRASARAPSEADDAQGGTRLYESLYATILRNGLPPALAEDLVGIFGFGIDFQRPVASDDRLELLFSPAEDANDRPDVLYASLVLGGETHRAYRFETPRTGAVAYFDEKGGSLRKFLLRKPIADGRITSPFGTRYHPILGYTKFHNGVDWANKAGTPILATGDGKMVSAGPRGGYGNRIEIQHANGYDCESVGVARGT